MSLLHLPQSTPETCVTSKVDDVEKVVGVEVGSGVGSDGRQRESVV